MRLIHIVETRPKLRVKLDPIDPQEFIVDKTVVEEWSKDNGELYELIIANGMAEWICNEEFLAAFYRELNFRSKGIVTLDPRVLRFTSLKTLSLLDNKIKVIENIPENLKELYLDFNCIEAIKTGALQLQLLSISHNNIDDALLANIVAVAGNLRCLNVANNILKMLKDFVKSIASCPNLKVLVAYENPLSMLPIYYDYITTSLTLYHFDGKKYVKPEIKKPEQPKPEKKDPPKEQKKDSKKQSKKQEKVQEKVVPVPVKVPEPPKVLTEQDFVRFKLMLNISNFQNAVGVCYDPSVFPQQNLDIKQTQTVYSLTYTFLKEQGIQFGKQVPFDSQTVQENETKLLFDAGLCLTIEANEASFAGFDAGIVIQVWKAEPKMIVDNQTGELKPVVVSGVIQILNTVIGAVHIDLRGLHSVKNKQMKRKYRLFAQQAVKDPLFANPYQNEAELVKERKDSFDKQLKQHQQARQKKLEQEQSLRKKPVAKDAKKPPEKKPAKKQGKQPQAGEKKKVQKCDYPLDQREYCYLGESKMHKASWELLCVHVALK